MWDLIVSVPDHCLSVYFHVSKTSDNCDIGVFVPVLEVSLRMKVISSP